MFKLLIYFFIICTIICEVPHETNFAEDIAFIRSKDPRFSLKWPWSDGDLFYIVKEHHNTNSKKNLITYAKHMCYSDKMRKLMTLIFLRIDYPQIDESVIFNYWSNLFAKNMPIYDDVRRLFDNYTKIESQDYDNYIIYAIVSMIFVYLVCTSIMFISAATYIIVYLRKK